MMEAIQKMTASSKAKAKKEIYNKISEMKETEKDIHELSFGEIPECPNDNGAINIGISINMLTMLMMSRKIGNLAQISTIHWELRGL